MRDDVRNAVLACATMSYNGKTQDGRHVEPLSDVIIADMTRVGYEDIRTEAQEVTMPGWFRPTKKWDIVAYNDGDLIGVIELKSIGGHKPDSVGKNINNRIEESLGSAMDLEYSSRNHLLDPTDSLPSFGYVIVVQENKKSLAVSDKSGSTNFRTDEVYKDKSLVDRFAIFGRRLLTERVYQSVWIVVADPLTGKVYEPDPMLTYAKFIARTKAWLDVARA